MGSSIVGAVAIVGAASIFGIACTAPLVCVWLGSVEVADARAPRINTLAEVDERLEAADEAEAQPEAQEMV